MQWVELQLLLVHVALSHHPHGLSVYEMLVYLLFQYYNVRRDAFWLCILPDNNEFSVQMYMYVVLLVNKLTTAQLWQQGFFGFGMTSLLKGIVFESA